MRPYWLFQEMKEISFIPEVFLLTLFVLQDEMVYSAGLDNLTSVLELTSNNFDGQIANKNLFVLMYEARYISYI